MYDPLTIAFELTWSFAPLSKLLKLKRKPKQHWIFTIWHKDPEIDGTDDSCGWRAPRITNEEFNAIEKLAEEEYEFVVGEQFGIKYEDPYGLIYWGWASLCDRISGRKRKAFHLSNGELNEVLSLAYNPADNLRGVAFDIYRGTESTRKEAFRRFLVLVYRCYKTYYRPWYQHPRWHIHHWHVQIHFIVNLKRYLFTKCQSCKKGFQWGASPIGTPGSKGPLWFRSELAWHSECTPHRKKSTK